MDRRDFRLVLGVCLLLVCAVPALADTRPTATDEETLARMEALLQAQQDRIERLQQQVAAQSDMDDARAQEMRRQIREVLSESEFRNEMMPSTLQAGYDDGFFIRSNDDKFKMTFFGRVQFRWTHYQSQPNNNYLLAGARRSDRTGFDANRVRFGVFGHAYTPDLTYYLEMEADEPNTYSFVLSEGWVDYRFMDELHFAAGLLKFASTRAQMTSDANLQFVDRPLADAVFGLGYGIGARFWGECMDGTVTWYLDIANSVTEGEGAAVGRTITPDETRELDNNPAIIFRTVYNVLGDGDMFVSQADHEISNEAGLQVGFHYMFNEVNGDQFTSRILYERDSFFREGGFGLVNSNGLQINQFGLDALFKWMGFSTSAEYIVRLVDVRASASAPYTPLYLATGDDSTTVQHGGYMQCGYFLPIPGLEKQLEAVARFGGVLTHAGGSEGTWEYAAGLNYYIVDDRVKLQTDVTKIYEVPISSTRYSLANVNDDALIWRVQLQVAF